jgi:3-oxoacyl-(acyl-carrier-protein) synthase
MRLLCRNSNDEPTKANRQMSALAKGFAPAAGAGMLVLEDYEHAKGRGAKIYAEILGGHINAGGQRNGGSMTLPNSKRVVDCIRRALEKSTIKAEQIDYINGHLTSTMADAIEVVNWCNALSLKDKFPYLNSTKSLIGHTIGAAGAIETIATILQMNGRFVHASLNSRPLHPEIEKVYDARMIPEETVENVDISYAVKANFGFGDVNACFVMRNPSLI